MQCVSSKNIIRDSLTTKAGMLENVRGFVGVWDTVRGVLEENLPEKLGFIWIRKTKMF